MNFARFLITIVLLQAARSGVGQTVNFTVKDVALADVFTIIKKQTGVLFFYDAALLQDTKTVTVELKNVPLETALNEIFKEQNLNWVLEDKTVTIVKNPFRYTKPVEDVSAEELSGHVKGTIKDIEGNPIHGVSVLIKDSKMGTVSNEAGKFFISADQTNTLVFSSVNYISKEVRVVKDKMNIVLEMDVKPMEVYFIGGNINAIKRKADATSVTILDSRRLGKIPANTLDQIFRGWVPGVNSFDIGPEPEGFPTLSIRGAAGPTSLDIISVYVDGIEYAGGSGYLSQLDKNNVDRIEVVRGPAAATMYGTGSNGGIVQIFSKAGRTDESSVSLTTSAGFFKSKWVKNDPFQQMHTLETTTGLKNIAIKIGGTYRTVDAYLPDGGEKNKGFYASARFTKRKLQVNLIGRYNVRNFSLSRKPYYDTAINHRDDIIIEPVPGLQTPAYKWFNVQPTASRNKNSITETYVNGINLTHKTNRSWTNNLSAGYTMNSSIEVPNNEGVNPLQRQYSSEKYEVITIRYSNVLRLYNDKNGFETVMNSGLEYKKQSVLTAFTRATAATTLLLDYPANENYGAFVQLNPSYKNVYLTMGLRYEHNNLFKAAWNPRIGLTTNFDMNIVTFKPKITWGRGITAPTYVQRFGRRLFSLTDPSNPDLKAQIQQGFDYGLELYDKKGKFRLETVYYDNVIKDMIGWLSGNFYTNVCKVANTGWEFSAEYQISRFTVQGTFTSMNSIIQDSTGSNILPQLKLAPGERLVNLPRHTAGFNISYNFSKLIGRIDKGSLSLNITEVDGVKSLDFRNYALDVSYGRALYDPGKIAYPVTYSPVFRVGLYADYFITNDLRFFVQGSNILNNYQYDYSNDYPTHGATWLFGFNYQFSKQK
ncbi:TonB-dependent receptor plug domain-containing protein [Flavitalea sp.]|nr:TonB-dependent receptor [Flavitalea sp.]